MKKFYSNKLAIFIFIAPAMILFSVMVFYPVLQVFYRSFFDWDGLSKATFIGIENYIELLDDSIFKTSIKNGLIFAVVITVFQLLIASVLAFAVSTAKIKGKSFFRIVYFIPVVLSVTVVCQLWLSMMNVDYGLFNKIFEALGLSYRQSWLQDRFKSIYAIAMVNGWHFMGYHFALILAGIKSIPGSYYEAAQIDGASGFKAHMKITLPLLAETYKFSLIMAVTGGLNAFTQMFIMTGGGPGTSTYTLTYLMYRSAFRVGEYGYGMASATVLILECLLATILINKLVARQRIVY